MREPPWRAPSEPSCVYRRPGSLFEILKVQSDVGNASLNHAANFRVELLGMVAHNGHGHDGFSHRQVRFSALGSLGPTPAHRFNRTGFNERLKHLFNFSDFRVEFLHWVSRPSASCGATSHMGILYRAVPEVGRVAQRDRASAFEAEGCRFELCRGRQTKRAKKEAPRRALGLETV